MQHLSDRARVILRMAWCCPKGNALAELKCFEETAPRAHPQATDKLGANGPERPRPGSRRRCMVLKSRWWWDLTTQDFADIDPQRVVSILPVGAVEQHGPHLPVRVDAAINAGIIARAVELMPPDHPALVLPMMAVGKSDEHLAFPGTLTLSYETLALVWFELCETVHRAGIRNTLYFNSHG